MTDLPPPRTYTHPTTGQVEIVQADGHGNHVLVAMSPGAQPWLVTVAARAAKAELMPGARAEQ